MKEFLKVVTETAQEVGRLKAKLMFIEAVIDTKMPDKSKVKRIKEELQS